jgi:hypothetical protein
MNKDDKALWVWCKKDPFAQKANKKKKKAYESRIKYENDKASELFLIYRSICFK